ncbi:MAG: hypothetical protein ACOX0A_04015 [Thermoguttaceae bacterium]|jgi:hypothetical protein
MDGIIRNRMFSSSLARYFAALVLLCVVAGCETQKGKLVDANSPDRVGSHKAGSEVYDPAAEAAVAGLLTQAAAAPLAYEEVGNTVGQINEFPAVRRVCFVGVENAGGEEMGDIRENLAETIRTMIAQSAEFDVIDSRLVAAGLRETGLRVDDLLLPDKRERFAAALGEMDSPFDYILFAKVTTATTADNADSQVKYSLTLDLVNVHSGSSIRQTAELKKHYNKSVKAKVKGMFS